MGFPPYALFLKGLGDGKEYQRIQSWIDFCFAFFYLLTVSNAVCLSRSFSL